MIHGPKQRWPAVLLALLVAAPPLTACGSSSGDAGDVIQQFGTAAAEIQGCDERLSADTQESSDQWPGATAVYSVICGPPEAAAEMLLQVAEYSAAGAARVAADDHDSERPLCVAGNAVVESWLSPYYAPDTKLADRVAQRWAHLYCERIGGEIARHRGAK